MILKTFGALLLIIFLLLNAYLIYANATRWVENYLVFKWLGIGILTYIIFSRILFKKNREWLKTFSHELTHTVVGLCFFRKIHSFNANDSGEGQIMHSGYSFGQIFISLAPYCLPIFTYVFLLFRLLSAEEQKFVFDVFIGFTLAFHINCFATQVGSYQSDLQKHGLTLSYLFIAAFFIFNICIVIFSVETTIIDAFRKIAIQYRNAILFCWNYVDWNTLLQKIQIVVEKLKIGNGSK